MTSFAPGRYAIAICGRCGFKYQYTELREDGNIKGLYVCYEHGCYDQLDPYKLPPRPPDNFVLHHPRPDLPISTVPNAILDSDGEQILADDDVFSP